MTADPLADVLLTAYREGVSAWMETPDEALGGFTSVDYGFASAARAAREHIAAEIEADSEDLDYTDVERTALTWAARLARGGTP